jgi:hypothetical protein
MLDLPFLQQAMTSRRSSRQYCSTPFAVIVGMIASGMYSAAYLEIRTELRRVAMLKKRLTPESIQAMLRDKQDVVTSGEFLIL